jgi:DNA-binding NarL/FixJ family response regulator
LRSKPLKIFITDDSEIILKKIPQMLSDIKNIRIVGHAGNAADTLRLVKELNPDVIILDIKLPGNNGIDILRILKSEKLVPIVIIFTNYPYPEYRQLCSELGADYFFDKSREFSMLIKTIRKIKGSAENHLLN